MTSLPNGREAVIYSGPSMNPTLKAPDILHIEYCNGREVKPGDVIVFQLPGENKYIIHRAVHVAKEGITTRGDNSSTPDPWFLMHDSVIGKVPAVLRGGKRKLLHGGLAGRLYVRGVRVLRFVRGLVLFLLRHPFDGISRAGILKKMLPMERMMKFVAIQRREGTEIQLLIGRFAAGRLLPGKSRWNVRRLFLPFVDTSILPTRGELDPEQKHP